MSLITDTPINCLSTVFATLPVAAVIVRDADGHPQIDRANEAFCELFEIDERPEALVGRRWLERWETLDQRRVLDNGAVLVADPSGVAGRNQVTMPDGRVLEIDIRRLPGDGPKAHILAFREVTHRHQVEQELRDSNRLLEAVAKIEADYLLQTGREEIFTLLLDALLDLTDSAFGFIGDVLYRPTGEPYVKVHHLTNIAWDDATQRLYERHHSGGLEFSNLDTLFGATLRTKQPVIANDPATDIRRGGLPPGHPPLTAFLGVPLKIGDRLIGMIGVANRPGGYSPELLEWLSPILAAATALFHAYRVDTERLDAEAALTEARDAAVAASRAKSEFVATVSHDMRTPLHALLGLSEMLLHNGLDGDQLRAVRAIHDSATSLSALIGDVLDFSQIEAGRVTITDEPFGLRRVLDHVETLLRPQAAAKGLTLHVTVPEVLPERYVGDAMRLQEVLVNLVANAVKFTETGGVHVLVADDRTGAARTGSEEGDARGRGLRIAVSDTGPGIGPQEQSRIFEPFDRGSAGAESPGTGLGLAIAHRIVGLLGGDLRLESAVGIGSTFSFCLPFPIAAGTTRPTASSPAGPVDSTDVVAAGRVLVVEDNEVNRLLAETQLRALGYESRLTSGAAEALTALASTRFDAVLMDLRMPEVDGVEATRRIRALDHPLASQVPIIAVSASATVQEQIRCLSAGMDDFLPKPVTLDSLRTMLSRWASGAPRRVDTWSTPQGTGASDLERLGDRFRTHLTDCLGDCAQGPYLLDAFLGELPALRVAIVEAVSAGDPAAITFAAHALKSAASAVAADELQAACARLEDATGAGADHDAAVIGHLAARVDQAGRATGQNLAALRATLEPVRAGSGGSVT